MENLNLYKILKSGDSIYHIVTGQMETIYNIDEYDIEFESYLYENKEDNGRVLYTQWIKPPIVSSKYGCMDSFFENAHCLVWPSKELYEKYPFNPKKAWNEYKN